MSTSMQTKIAVFYHVAMMEGWERIDAEIMVRLRDSGLLDRADMFIRNECRDIGQFEFPTLNMLDEFSVRNNYSVLYLHTKGVSRKEESIADWRECMLYWMVDRWKECVDKLNRGYDAVGINLVDKPIRHFQGNFWWANTEHIRRLGTVDAVKFPPRHDLSDRHKAEFWILGVPARVYTPYHHRINPYIDKNPKSNYVGKQF